MATGARSREVFVLRVGDSRLTACRPLLTGRRVASWRFPNSAGRSWSCDDERRLSGDNTQRSSRKTRGFVNAPLVHVVSFWTTAGCILIAVVAAILAIWEFTGTDVLWRTVATCVVVGAGTLTFAWVNGMFATEED